MKFLTSFLLLITLITINLGVSEAFTCEEGWLQGPGDLQQYCYNILGAEVDYYPQYMSFYECKQDCNGIGGIFENSLQQKEAYVLELVSKELNHLAAILHAYAGVLIFIK